MGLFLGVLAHIWSQGRALRDAQREARIALYAVGRVKQALIDTANHPLVDSSTANVLSAILHDLNKDLYPILREDNE